jgi:hydrogenase maturation protease
MNLERVDQIAKAVLYEGYMLYPYRPSSVKNRQRWNFGVVCPPAYCDAQVGNESSSMRTECLVLGAGAAVDLKLRFLQLRVRSAVSSTQTTGTSLPDGWQEAVEREISVPALRIADSVGQCMTNRFSFDAQTTSETETDSNGGAHEVVRSQLALEGEIGVTVSRVRDDLSMLSVVVRNITTPAAASTDRDVALVQSLVSTHVILGVSGGEFVSLLEPPDELRPFVAQCQNVGAWPVLVGDAGQRDTMLASPVILYDYPQIAPESVGDLFDGTEIDEILSLRIMTLTDDEKREIRDSDERARQILERTESMPAEQFMKLHGAVRGMRPLKEDAS